jgi:hypothetical protein
MSELMLLKCLDKRYEYEDCINCIAMGGSTIPYKVQIGHERATALYGDSGNLPDQGEIGLVAHLPEYGNRYIWICSIHDMVENMCSSELGKDISYRENGIWTKVADDGDVEMYHPSGLFIKIGDDTSKSSNTRFQRTAGSSNVKSEVAYVDRITPVKNVYIKHGWGSNASDAKLPTDNRREQAAAASNSTELLMSTTGVVTLTHHTTAGNTIINIDNAGNVTYTVPVTETTDAEHIIRNIVDEIINASAETRIVTPLTNVVSPLINLGSMTRASLHKLIDERFKTLFDQHVHSGVTSGSVNTGTPTVSLDLATNATNITRAE